MRDIGQPFKFGAPANSFYMIRNGVTENLTYIHLYKAKWLAER